MDLAVISLAHLLVLVGWLGGQVLAVLAWRAALTAPETARPDLRAIGGLGLTTAHMAQVLALPTGLLLAWRIGWWEVPALVPLGLAVLGVGLAFLQTSKAGAAWFGWVRQGLVVVVIVCLVPVIPAGQTETGPAFAPLLTLPEAGYLKLIVLGLALLCCDTSDRLMRPAPRPPVVWVVVGVGMACLLLLCASLVGLSGPGVLGSVAWIR